MDVHIIISFTYSSIVQIVRLEKRQNIKGRNNYGVYGLQGLRFTYCRVKGLRLSLLVVMYLGFMS